ncbi:hypothetical protein F4805DRAFT_461586 [Annulohypoxylon moriforme]|nr:hypothetical protein F4805DRAFT_461586 [Annulohypoxylon moriforme]
MASFGQLTNAFIKASQETTLALANFNFDFSIVKFDAPAEYKGLGNALSKRRKQAAEDGPVHVTAQKLKALFRGVIPECPNLIQAYGLRASQIANLPEVNPQSSTGHGVFADHVGADGTTIWAAATSGKETVTIHLLACMLARMWNREQSVSIWSELVEQRKKYLQNLAAESAFTLHISDLTASRIEITRSQLDEWDRSARAWLQTADTAKMIPQTQFRLLVDNISLPVSDRDVVLDAVLEAWTKALRALESLIEGKALQINDGAVLLGLSAWHLYPDIYLAGTNQYIKQGDELVHPGGIITLGLISREEDNGKGVYWSLPLAHARYYGGAEIAKRHAGVRESQVSFEEFMFVVLGSILGGWNIRELDLSTQMGLIQDICTAAPHDFRRRQGHDMDRVIKCLSSLAGQYAKATDVYKQQITRLISFGRRRCSNFLAPSQSQSPPAFGLVNFVTLMNAFIEDYGGRIKLLRSWAKREMPLDFTASAIIRYHTDRYSVARYTNMGDEVSRKRKRQRTPTQDNGSSRTENTLFHWVQENDNLIVDDEEQEDGEVWIPPGPGQEPQRYIFFCGDPKLAAIYVPASKEMPEVPHNNCMSVSQLIRCIQQGNVGRLQISFALPKIVSSPLHEVYFDSLQAIGRAESIYSKLPGAKVDLQVTSTRVNEAKWWKETQLRGARTLKAIFSCIAYFETGIFDADPDTIGEQTFALCHGTSIFVASGLLTDPIDEVPIIPVERIVVGVQLLICPLMEKHRTVSLSFTGYEQALDLERQSGRDAPAHFIETAISVYDKGKWVADLDIIKASRSWIKDMSWDCQHSDEQKANISTLRSIVSIDSWDELLDPPIENAIVRGYGNPTARLATAALAVRMGLRVTILPSRPCWICLQTGTAPQADVPQTPEIDVEDNEGGYDSDGEDTEEGSCSETDSSLDDSDEEIYAFNIPAPEAVNEDQEKQRVILIY